jgi:hypothetical protein
MRVKGVRLGRGHFVIRETWLLSDDPAVVAPRQAVVSSDRTAADAADFARQLASTYAKYGFHKPTRCWWGSDGELFHRFAVSGRRLRRLAPAGLALLVGLGVFKALGSRRRRKTTGSGD